MWHVTYRRSHATLLVVRAPTTRADPRAARARGATGDVSSRVAPAAAPPTSRQPAECGSGTTRLSRRRTIEFSKLLYLHSIRRIILHSMCSARLSSDPTTAAAVGRAVVEEPHAMLFKSRALALRTTHPIIVHDHGPDGAGRADAAHEVRRAVRIELAR